MLIIPFILVHGVTAAPMGTDGLHIIEIAPHNASNCASAQTQMMRLIAVVRRLAPLRMRLSPEGPCFHKNRPAICSFCAFQR